MFSLAPPHPDVTLAWGGGTWRAAAGRNLSFTGFGQSHPSQHKALASPLLPWDASRFPISPITFLPWTGHLSPSCRACGHVWLARGCAKEKIRNSFAREDKGCHREEKSQSRSDFPKPGSRGAAGFTALPSRMAGQTGRWLLAECALWRMPL